MEKISQWCKLIAVFSIITSAVTVILPESMCKKTTNFLMSVMLIYSLVLPFSEAVTDIDISSYFNKVKHSDESAQMAEYENYALEFAAETETEKYLNEFLLRSDIRVECKVSCSYENDAVRINKVTVSGSLRYCEKEKISEEIRRISGDEVIINFTGDEYEQ